MTSNMDARSFLLFLSHFDFFSLLRMSNLEYVLIAGCQHFCSRCCFDVIDHIFGMVSSFSPTI